MTAERAYKNITAQTLDLLREAIVHAEYQPGHKLRIDQLAKSLSVSIGAVREALSRLTAEGLVVAEPNKGFIVAPISRRDLEDLTAVRIEVESTCLEQAIEHGDVDWEGRILSSHHKLRALGNAYLQPGTDAARQWHELHETFHDVLASACPNTWWLWLRRRLYVQSERYRRISGPIDGTQRDIVVEHEAIANAALARDAVAARKAMTMHLARTTEIILSSDFLSEENEDKQSGGVIPRAIERASIPRMTEIIQRREAR